MPVPLRRHYWLAVALVTATPVNAQLSKPGTAPAQGPDTPKQATDAAVPPDAAGQTDPNGTAPIVPEAEFEAAMPPLSGDINAPLEPMPAEQGGTAKPAQAAAPTPTQSAPVAADATTLPPVATEDAQLDQPLVPLASFNSVPLDDGSAAKDPDAPQIRYATEVTGLDKLDLTGRFKSLSALQAGKGKAANATQVAARGREDEALAVRLMKSLGYYDATAIATVSQDKAAPGTLKVTLAASPGRLYTFSSITVDAAPTVPADLIRTNLPLKVGEPIEAARVEGAEANVSLQLPRQGYPFVKVGDRDILLDDQAQQATGAYTLPVDTGPRSSFGVLTTNGDQVFGLDHLNLFPRFKEGQLYDSQMTDDLRDALVATGLFSGIAVVPQRTGRTGPDGTEQVDLLVTQTKGPSHSLSGSAGYETGQGFKAQGSWTNRNAFPDEGALIGTVIAGTQEQGLSGTFRRSNAGRRDRTFTAIASIDHSNYDAFNAFTGTLSARWSYDSTPIWQKRLTYYYGGELIFSNERAYSFAEDRYVRRNYGIAALPAQVLFDTSNDLLNPTRGYRLTVNVSPEAAVSGAVRPYARTMLTGTYYYPVSTSLVIAGRARAGSIFGIARNDLAPSRRYYGGGGGSVRGYGYQRLGPLDPNGNPVGGRSLNEFSIEGRYRFGNFGIVPFLDAGNSYASTFPSFSDLKFGAGIGGRFYTNFGPLRVDVATPLNKRPGDSRIALYIGIGQAF